MMQCHITTAGREVNAATRPRYADAMSFEAPRPFDARRFVPLGILLLAGVLFGVLGGGHYLSFAALAANREWLIKSIEGAAAPAAAAFIVGYAILVALLFPAAELLTIIGGLLFGRWLGTIYVVIGATSGATIVFLAARAGLAGVVVRAGPWAGRLAAGFRRDALNYLLFLRLVPLFPFWLVNLVAGAAGLPLRTYVAGTLVGIIPGTFVYASLGVGLGAVIAEGRRPDLAAIFRPSILLPLIGLAALALLPVLYRRWRGGRRGQPPT
jgi:uncharacterized membrane protein YdjX (TVP38/TMEM64 family)